MKKELFGLTSENQAVYKYGIKSKSAYVELIDYGARITGFTVNGIQTVQSFDSLDSYISDIFNLGATVGRVCNRIKGATLTIDGVSYSLTNNSNGNCLHGGSGIQRKVWEPVSQSENEITFYLFSQSGEDGFPGALHIFATFTLIGSALIISYRAVPSEKTAIALTSHPYFNLDGYECDTQSHVLTLYADRYTEVDSALLPTGNRPRVDGTAYDFRTPKQITRDIGTNLTNYDTNFFLVPTAFKEFLGKNLALAAIAESRTLRLYTYTDQKCVQLYTPIYWSGHPLMTGGVERRDFCAFCLEAQIEPNSVNLGEGIYEAGEVYESTCVYEIEVIK